MNIIKQNLKLLVFINYRGASKQSLGVGNDDATRRKSKQTLDLFRGICYYKNGFLCSRFNKIGLKVEATLKVEFDIFSLVTDGVEIAAQAISLVANIAKWISRQNVTDRPLRATLVDIKTICWSRQ